MRNNNIEEVRKSYKPWLDISLSIEEEKNLMKLAAEGNEEAQEQLVKGNIKYAFNFALKKVKYSPIDLADLIQVCAEGLVDASKHIKKGYDNKFITYASYRMLEKVDKEFSKCGNKFSLSVENFKRLKKIVAIFNKYIKDYGQEKIARELTAKELGIKIEEVEELLLCADEYASYDSIIEADDGNKSFCFEDETTICPDEFAIIEDCKEMVGKAVSKLDKFHRLIIEKRFGLNGQEEKNYSKIAKEYNHSRAWSSNLGREALNTLKNNRELQSLIV